MGPSTPSGLQQPVRSRRRVVRRAGLFVIVAFAASWTPLAILLATTGDHTAGAGSMALFLAGGTGPMLAAVVAAAALDGRRGLRMLLTGIRRWRVGRWYLLLVAPLPVALLAMLLAVLLGPASADPAGIGHWLLLPAYLVSGVLVGGLEEIGWRGYLQPVLQGRWSAAAVSLAIGLIWALWHAPLFWLASTTQAETSTVAFVVQAVALSVIFAWAYNATAGSALLAILLHGAINGWYSLVVQGIAPAAAAEFAVGTATITVVLALVLLARYGPTDLAGCSRIAWTESSASPDTGGPRG